MGMRGKENSEQMKHAVTAMSIACTGVWDDY
jgi:hypothetical protein